MPPLIRTFQDGMTHLFRDLHNRVRNLEMTPPYNALVQMAEDDSSCSTTSAVAGDPTTGTGGPSVSATIGPSGRAIVQTSAASSTTGTNGGIYIAVDGTTVNQLIVVDAAGWNTLCGVVLLSGLAPGVHSFKLRYQSISGTASFYQRTLVVTPL